MIACCYHAVLIPWNFTYSPFHQLLLFKIIFLVYGDEWIRERMQIVTIAQSYCFYFVHTVLHQIIVCCLFHLHHCSIIIVLFFIFYHSSTYMLLSCSECFSDARTSKYWWWYNIRYTLAVLSSLYIRHSVLIILLSINLSVNCLWIEFYLRPLFLLLLICSPSHAIFILHRQNIFVVYFILVNSLSVVV